MKGKKPHAAAEREALEEAGVGGRIGKAASGRHGYGKRLANGAAIASPVVPALLNLAPSVISIRR